MSKYSARYEQEDSRTERQREIARLAKEYDGSFPLYDYRDNNKLGYSIKKEHWNHEIYALYIKDKNFYKPGIKICSVNLLQDSFWSLTARLSHIPSDKLQVYVVNVRGYGEFFIRHNLKAQEIKENKIVNNSYDLFYSKWEEIPVRIEQVKGSLE